MDIRTFKLKALKAWILIKYKNIYARWNIDTSTAHGMDTIKEVIEIDFTSWN